MRPLRTPFHALVSFHYFNAEPDYAVIAKGAGLGVRWIGDSGAFSALTSGAPIDRDEYARWVHRNREHLSWAASLDVIGDPDASLRNYKALARQGLDVVPTIHFGTPAEEIDKYADEGVTFMGLGGIASRMYSQKAVLRWLVSIFRYARDHHPQTRFHGWGIAHLGYLNHLPFWSTDCAGFGQAYRFARATLFDPDRVKKFDVRLDGSAAGRHGALLRKHYGFAPREVASISAGNKPLIYLLAAHTPQVMSEFYTARHRVTPPPGHEADGMGTHIHFADSDRYTFRQLLPLLETAYQPDDEEAVTA